ncbi:Uncharacterized protein TCM_032176 [Theobroma cacao]|uniref:Uncharacterized protein n=1 Tax=Theobroma cacao TaxID=3641 RepID=A0A061F883_THECC|nr:Uncharacterized protein TCM_032176 [Theobroma cacao]
MAKGNPSHSLTIHSKISFTDGTFRTPRPTFSKNKFMDSSFESGCTLTISQSIDIQTSTDLLVNTTLLPLLGVGLGIPTSKRENFFQTSSKINTYLLCPNCSINAATRLCSSSGKGTIFTAIAICSCNLVMLSSFETVTQITSSNRPLVSSDSLLHMCFMTVVFPIPPIPQTPIIPISSPIK